VRIREFSRHRLHVPRPIEAGRWGWECGRPLDLCRVMFEPLSVIEGDRSDDAAAVAIGGREAAFLDGTLRENNLVAEWADAHRFDVHAKLAGPERGQRKVRAAVGFEAHHVVCRDRGPEDSVVPMLQREELVLVQHVGEARDVADDEDGVGHHAVDVEGTTARVAADAPEAGRQPGPLQPLGVADRTEAADHYATLYHPLAPHP